MSELITIRPELLSLSPEQAQALIPYFWIFGGATLALLACVLKAVRPKWPTFIISVVTVIGGMVATAAALNSPTQELFNRMMVVDSFSTLFNLVFLGSALITLLVSVRYLDKEGLQHPEYYVLVLFSALGMMLLGSAQDLIVLFIALEIMSLAIYVLVGFRRADRRSNEAAMKYFILGSAASAVLLYGAALLYGATGTLNIREILAFVSSDGHTTSGLYVVGAWLVVVGFLFKVASVPFHMWMPDVYEGAPTPITGFMTTGLKAAAFAAFVRVFVSMGFGKGLSEVLQQNIHHILWASAVLTMVVGNVVALTQSNLKRMLGYSSIAHTGYLLVGVLAGHLSPEGYSPIFMYLVAYSVMNLGAFAILSILSTSSDSGVNLHDLAGLAKRHPWLSFALAVFMLSMAGVPPTAGFIAKYLLLYSAVQAGEVPLVVISVLCSAISVYYYLRVLVYMYMREPAGFVPAARVPFWSGLAVAAMVALTLHIGVLPSPVLAAAKKAIVAQ